MKNTFLKGKIQKLYEGFSECASALCGPERAYFEFIGELTKQVNPKKVLEIGSGWGLSAIAFLINSNAYLTTIDKQPLETLHLFKERIDLFELWDRIKFISGASRDILPTLPDNEFDIVYIDGDHTYKGVKLDLQFAHGKVRKGGILLLDDVFHYLNWVNRAKSLDEEGPEFGVLRALGEYVMAGEHKLVIYSVANGFGKVIL